MADDIIPGDVSEFILTNVDSVAQLEGLLLLRADPGGCWDARMVSLRLYISEKEAFDLLAKLADRGFLKKEKEEGPSSFRYEPVSQQMDDMARIVADLYARCLVPVTQLIHTKPSKSVQRFADAFRIRKDKE